MKEASDIVAVVGQYLTLKPAGKVFKGLCPFHNDSRPSFDVDPKFQNYRCWSCGAKGDVIKFVQDHDKISFLDAIELLAHRAGINLDQHKRPVDAAKLRLMAVLKWAEGLYQKCLLEDPAAESARLYLGERRLLGETVRKFGLGFVPPVWDFIAKQMHAAPAPPEVLVEAGLILPRKEKEGYFDKFRDRVMFPIRNLTGQTVGFGGRILPGSVFGEREAKYINSSDSDAFKKSELVYGLDTARLAAQTAGFLAVVEGYTDVLMAHQCGVTNVVASMGTALGGEHLRQVRRFAPRVVLVYDADAGGQTGIDRALELFIREDMDLAIARLPEGLDPYDLLVKQGAEPFQAALAEAVDVLDYKMDAVLTQSAGDTVEAGRKTVESVLGMLALAPTAATTKTQIRRELILSRVAKRFGLREETLGRRLRELQSQRPREDSPARANADEVALTRQMGGAVPDPIERELVEVLLAEPVLTAKAKAEIAPERIQHAGLQRIVTEMYDLIGNGILPELDAVRMRLIDKPRLADFAFRFYEIGSMNKERHAWFERILQGFRDRDTARASSALKSQLKAAGDPQQALDLLRKLQAATAPAAAE